MEELCEAFSLERIGKSGARFDFEKAKWYNQQYIIASSDEKLAELVQPMLVKAEYSVDINYVITFCGLMKERVSLMTEFVETGYYFFEGVKAYDEKNVRKRWKMEKRQQFEYLGDLLAGIETFTAENVEAVIKEFINESGLKFGEVFPMLRIALAGSMSGPDLFKMMALLGKETVTGRLKKAFNYFDEVCLAM